MIRRISAPIQFTLPIDYIANLGKICIRYHTFNIPIFHIKKLQPVTAQHQAFASPINRHRVTDIDYGNRFYTIREANNNPVIEIVVILDYATCF